MRPLEAPGWPLPGPQPPAAGPRAGLGGGLRLPPLRPHALCRAFPDAALGAGRAIAQGARLAMLGRARAASTSLQTSLVVLPRPQGLVARGP